MGLVMAPELASNNNLVENLDSTDPDLVMTSLSILGERADSSGQKKANLLLSSKNKYIWLNAAMYLGKIGDENSIPYLIKGLKHPAWRAHEKIASMLNKLTGLKYGKDQAKWISWWKQKNPESTFNFRYLDLEKEAESLNSTNHYLITGVVDPLTINHSGVQIRLIGIKLKDKENPQQAIVKLKTLILGQFAQFEFDQGAKLDKNKARRAFVYWVSSSPAGKMFRRGLKPVPFTQKTLINSFLLKSGLYEIDSDSVKSEAMKKTLEQASNP